MRIFPVAAVVAVAAVLLSGCRREDIREMAGATPERKDADRKTVEAARQKYDGVDKRSYRWDMDAKTLWLRYDSMKIAQSNIRYAIDEKGVKVQFPEKKTDRAG